ncbi:MAG: hypothetical protein V3S01_03600 [Dehalococcoidia bacterium]
MTSTEAKSLVRSLRRQFFLASVWRILVLAVVALGFLGSVVQTEADGQSEALWYAALIAAGLWMLLTMISVRQVKAANQASIYISSGRLDLAEAQLKSAMHQFSLYRMGKLLVCHNLAVVAHGQKNYQAAAELCDGVISLCGGISRSVGRLCRMLLADCRLFLGDSVSADRALAPLSLQDPAMSLSEQLMLLPIELRCRIARGDFEGAAERLSWKVRLAELLDSPKAGLVHALLARVCGEVGKREAAVFLRGRAKLYHDLDELAKEYEILRDSAPGAQDADNNQGSSS